MTETKDTLTAHENEVLALTWQCFETEPKYTSSSARFTLGKIKTKLKALTAGISEGNPTALAVKGGGRKPAAKKRAAKSVENRDDEEAGEEKQKPKPRKRAKKATQGPELDGNDVDKMMGLGGGGDVKVKPEPKDVGFGWGEKGDEEEGV